MSSRPRTWLWLVPACVLALAILVWGIASMRSPDLRAGNQTALVGTWRRTGGDLRVNQGGRPDPLRLATLAQVVIDSAGLPPPQVAVTLTWMDGKQWKTAGSSEMLPGYLTFACIVAGQRFHLTIVRDADGQVTIDDGLHLFALEGP